MDLEQPRKVTPALMWETVRRGATLGCEKPGRRLYSYAPGSHRLPLASRPMDANSEAVGARKLPEMRTPGPGSHQCSWVLGTPHEPSVATWEWRPRVPGLLIFKRSYKSKWHFNISNINSIYVY